MVLFNWRTHDYVQQCREGRVLAQARRGYTYPPPSVGYGNFDAGNLVAPIIGYRSIHSSTENTGRKRPHQVQRHGEVEMALQVTRSLFANGHERVQLQTCLTPLCQCGTQSFVLCTYTRPSFNIMTAIQKSSVTHENKTTDAHNASDSVICTRHPVSPILRHE